MHALKPAFKVRLTKEWTSVRYSLRYFPALNRGGPASNLLCPVCCGYAAFGHSIQPLSIMAEASGPLGGCFGHYLNALALAEIDEYEKAKQAVIASEPKLQMVKQRAPTLDLLSLKIQFALLAARLDMPQEASSR
jgi:hypothetical protein